MRSKCNQVYVDTEIKHNTMNYIELHSHQCIHTLTYKSYNLYTFKYQTRVGGGGVINASPTEIDSSEPKCHYSSCHPLNSSHTHSQLFMESTLACLYTEANYDSQLISCSYTCICGVGTPMAVNSE